MTVHYQLPSHALPVNATTGVEPQTRTVSPAFYRNGFKRIFDTLAILMSLPVILPMILLLAVVAAHDSGPPFFRQLRVGRGGRLYTMWKLRTMVVDAETKLEAHLAADPSARSEWDSTQKLKADPRITRIGRFLRKSSLDELPQLWNVLRGDMSLVGPRPMLPEQAPLYPGKSYHALRPGITGLWQVSERNDSSFADRAQYDTRYDRTLSLATDLRLLVATIRVVVRGTGY